jgi:hypothetical protein
MFHRRAAVRRGAVWFLAWLAATLGSVTYFVEHRTTPVDPDEIYWIGSAYYYHLAFERGEWNHPDWKLMSARENPPVSKYVMGLGLAMAGQHIVDREMLGCFVLMFKDPRKWGEGAYYERRMADIGNMTAERCARPLGGPGVTNKPALLLYARRVMLVATILASLVILVLGASVANPATGLIASQLFLLHPITIFTYNHAMADAAALLFSAIAALATWRFLQRLTEAAPVTLRDGTALTLFSGTALALASGAKMNSLIIVMVFGLAVVGVATMALRQGDRPRAVHALAYGVATAVVAFGLFVLINPAILADFTGSLRAVFAEQRVGLEFTMRAMPELRLQGLDDKFGAVSHVAFGPMTFTLGAVICLVPALRSRRPGPWLIAVWWIVAVVVVTAWIPIAWGRYVLPVVAPSALLLAHALVSGRAAVMGLQRRQSALSRGAA